MSEEAVVIEPANNTQGRAPSREHRRGGHKKQQHEKKEFLEEVIQIDRVTRVVKGGRRLRFRSTVVIGNKKGTVGLGLGKAADVVTGIQKAITQAKKNLINIQIVNGTVPHQVQFKYKSAKLMLMPGKEGAGIIAGGAVRKICDLVGIKDIVAKTHGTSNKIVIAKATILALQTLSAPKKTDSSESDKKDIKGKTEQEAHKTEKKEEKKD